MNTQELQKLKYPIGTFKSPDPITPVHLEEWISILELFPELLNTLVEPLSEEQLNTPYRPEGWTVRQVVHHLADSHHHSYIRFKWALTESTPQIKAYNEADWAELFDSKTAPIDLSLAHLKAVHKKLVYLLRGLSFQDMEANFIHPENNNTFNLKEMTGMYAWHSQHHYTHIKNLIKRNNW